jgi:F-type H+-transporting ATPase subunit c
MSRRRHYAAAMLAGLVVLLASPLAFAEEASAGAEGTLWGIALGAGLAIGLAAFGGALGQGRAGAAALEGIARNPGASGKLFTPMILVLALIESLVIYALIIAFMLSGKVPTITFGA